MELFMTNHAKADGGYPLDSDLDQMTDDGCPLVPDPARWSDAAWRDNLGELDTFEGPLAGRNEPAALAQRTKSGPSAVGRSRTLRCRTCGRTEMHSPEDLMWRYGARGRPECCECVMDYFAILPPPDAVAPHTVAA
jgi:hypothetical protein